MFAALGISGIIAYMVGTGESVTLEDGRSMPIFFLEYFFNPEREGLLRTPERMAKAMQFLTHGYDINPDDLMKQAIFHEEYSEMVIVKDIEVYSMCEHHMLPF